MKQLPAYLPKAALHRVGDTLEEVIEAVDREVGSFLRALQAVPDERLHAPIATERWSPAEYADHLVRSTALYLDAIARTSDGRPTLAYEHGWLRDDGRMLTVPDAEPTPGRGRGELEVDLLAATQRLADGARGAQRAGHLSTVCMQNPFFGDMTVLEVVQLAAAHARLHRGHIVGSRS